MIDAILGWSVLLLIIASIIKVFGIHAKVNEINARVSAIQDSLVDLRKMFSEKISNSENKENDS